MCLSSHTLRLTEFLFWKSSLALFIQASVNQILFLQKSNRGKELHLSPEAKVQHHPLFQNRASPIFNRKGKERGFSIEGVLAPSRGQNHALQFGGTNPWARLPAKCGNCWCRVKYLLVPKPCLLLLEHVPFLGSTGASLFSLANESSTVCLLPVHSGRGLCCLVPSLMVL